MSLSDVVEAPTGALKLNVETLRRLDVTVAQEPKPPVKSSACPPSLRTRVTAHCC